MGQQYESSSPAARRIALTIPSMGAGGAERVMSVLANHWAAAGHDVTLITLEAVASDLQTLDPRIVRIGLDAVRHAQTPLHGLWNNLRRVRELRRALRSARPDVIVSFLGQMNVLTLLASRGLCAPVVVAERTNPERHRIGPTWSVLRRLTYRFSSAVVVQTEAAKAQLPGAVAAPKICIIPNSVERSPSSAQIDARRIAAMGRLAPEKGFDLLIEAFSQVAPRYPEWDLVILGDGPERGALQTQAEGAGLTGRVRFRGWIAEPRQVLCDCALFVLSSRYEGFPNALLEAMACGLPVVSFDCPHGPREIIRHDIDGLLVPSGSVSELAAALQRLISDPALRHRLGQAAREVVRRFSPPEFFRRWDTVVLGPTADATRPEQ